MKQFKMQHLDFPQATETFDEATAPIWLCKGGIKGSTMDNRPFWNNNVITLDIGASVKTDFWEISRTA
jgi:hypothetical protein